MNDRPASSQPSTRLYYLDALRVIAILIVFLFHAVHPYDMWDWHIKNVEQSLTLTVLITILALWGMPFFFMIAGAGSWFALRRRTSRQYIVERTKRLLVPFLFGTLLVYVYTQYLQWDNQVYRGVVAVPFLEYLVENLSWYLSLGFTPRYWGIGVHLWFLGFLWVFALLSLPLFQWLKGEKGGRFLDRLASVCDKRLGLLIFFVPLVLIRYLLTPFFPDEHNWSDFLFQGSFFILGYLLFASERLNQAVRRDGPLLGGIGLAALLLLLIIYFINPAAGDWVEAYGTGGFYLAMGTVVLIGLTWSLAMLFIGMRYMDKDRVWVRYANELALPFFIVHQPVIIFIASFVIKWELATPLKLVITVLGSFLAAWGLVEFVIKRVGFLRFLFGMPAVRSEVKKESQPTPTGVG